MVLQEVLQSQVLSIIQFALVIGIGVVATKILTDALRAFFHRPEIKKVILDMGYEEPVIDFVLVMLRYVFYFMTFIVALSQFGFATIVFDILIIIIAFFVVVLIVYTLKDFIPNAAAGIYLGRVKSIKKGDIITVGVYHGKIEDFNLMTTTLQDETGRITIIPNANLTRKEIIIHKQKLKHIKGKALKKK
jgi:small-conductance mechanosensitive channel